MAEAVASLPPPRLEMRGVSKSFAAPHALTDDTVDVG